MMVLSGADQLPMYKAAARDQPTSSVARTGTLAIAPRFTLFSAIGSDLGSLVML